jgi:acetyl esterase/lipase
MKTGAIVLIAGLAAGGAALAQGRVAPARPLPTPTDVSPQMQVLSDRAPAANFIDVPKTVDQWVARQRMSAETGARTAADMAARLRVKVEPKTMGGVPVFEVTPEKLPPENRNRLLIHIHGGCYVLGGGRAATVEAVLMAGLGGYRVISVDYRMPPAAYFPAAIDDVIAVWKEALKSRKARQMAIFGSSAGGALTLATVVRAKQLGLPLPGAIAPGTPMADLTGVGDSFATNAMIDNILVSRDGFCDPAAQLYANGHDLKDPLLSPVYADFRGFPPAILTTGTRDLLLSNTVRTHRRMKDAGVPAELNVFEAQAHNQYGRDDTAPETRAAFGDIAAFFDRHLAK